ncbi:efflux RND transporter periplasmic adaptor subunit [Candidatus Nucleicultrix amoebiphila]|uniref:Uncharacterized protein n=1 Tax=Candidatus Nucleicultrix amoebiphila FS5 TaxID=1414854 RepID=A0A1W6N6D2_9PROT|nr:efflux RND transporter periplasmic adaptor subunit [Candidatus Nucleicultrix amoebiphila]ARN85306.1 hypothetical protein GQ61_08440 [Candidatus Nucleicultrix amoebiphila FS5]
MIRSLFFFLLILITPLHAAEGPGKIGVKTDFVTKGEISKLFRNFGQIEASRQADILAQVDGQVAKVLVKDGELVKAGQELLLLDTKWSRNLEGIKEKQEALVKKRLARLKKLHSANTIATKDLERQEMDLLQVEASVNELKDTLNKSVIKAPFDGIVGEIKFKAGTVLKKNDNILRLRDISPFEVIFEIPGDERKNIKIGQLVDVYVSETPAKKVSASISEINPFIAPDTYTVKIKAIIENPKDSLDLLTPGMIVPIVVKLLSYEDAILLPLSALVVDEKGIGVYKVIEGKAKRVTVEYDLMQDEFIRVIKGVEKGDQVIVQGQDNVFEGAELNILDSQKK